ncbi:MAG: teichoic acid biosynthesis protein [Deltaproteobacteria bacterium]|nr:teichoic acid biosynthesis protein [Deltaproteobacteria bacterium]
MRILYGVVGAGMGHATRSRVVVDHLVARGHQIVVVVSGGAYRMLLRHYADTEVVTVREIAGLSAVYRDNALCVGSTAVAFLDRALGRIATNIGTYLQIAGPFHAVISDFESWAAMFGLVHGIPVLSIDNMQVLHRCGHDPEVTDGDCLAFCIARAAVQAKVPGAHHYLVASYFPAQVRKARTTLVPPILRPEILAAHPKPGDHVLVYQSVWSSRLMEALWALPYAFVAYGAGRGGQERNVTFRAFHEEGFVEDLRTARAVIAGGGFSLMSEAVHLGIPMLAMPLEGQYEQVLNARYLAKLGYGAWTRSLDGDTVASFLSELPQYRRNLADYPRRDNAMLLARLDALLWEVARPARRAA